MIDQHTELYCVIGSPVGHSLSPAMHNAAFSALHLNALYMAFEVKDLAGCLNGVRAFGIRGVSVTIPHKSSVIPFLDQVDQCALDIGSVNTIVNRNNKLKGYNTDALGAYAALKKVIDPSGKDCIIIGAGGAARAIGYILRNKGCKIIITNRSKGRGEDLSGFLNCDFIPLEEIGDRGSDILINTTPVGMYPKVNDIPATKALLKKGMCCMDIVYNPLETRLLRTAKSLGCRTVNGLGMFVYQGAEQFRIWTGLEPPVDIMTKVIERILRQ